MENCLVTKLKVNVQNENLPYLYKGVLLYDSNIGSATAGYNTYNSIRLGTRNYENIDSDIFEAAYMSDGNKNLRVKNGVSVPTNYTRTMYYQLDEITYVLGNNGSGYKADYNKFKLRLEDLSRCTNITKFEPYGILFSDTETPNIEKLSSLINCSYFDCQGKTSNNWCGDLVNLTDGLINNGIDISQVPVIVVGHNINSNYKINGASVPASSNYEHIVFASEGHYYIYTNVNSYVPLTPQDYAGMTPAYTK